MANNLDKALANVKREEIKAEQELLALKAKHADELVKNKFAISAKEARRVADTTNCMLNHIYKEISEASKDGYVHLTWGINDRSTTLISHIATELQNNGYSVSIEYADFDGKEAPVCLNINW